MCLKTNEKLKNNTVKNRMNPYWTINPQKGKFKAVCELDTLYSSYTGTAVNADPNMAMVRAFEYAEDKAKKNKFEQVKLSLETNKKLGYVTATLKFPGEPLVSVTYTLQDLGESHALPLCDEAITKLTAVAVKAVYNTALN